MGSLSERSKKRVALYGERNEIFSRRECHRVLKIKNKPGKGAPGERTQGIRGRRNRRVVGEDCPPRFGIEHAASSRWKRPNKISRINLIWTAIPQASGTKDRCPELGNSI